MTTLERITGVVDRVNPKGLRLRGEGEWRNYSKYADLMDIETPSVGAHVGVDLDSSGFVRAVRLLDEQPQQETPAQERPEPEFSRRRENEHPDRDTTITRLAVLKAAATVVSSQGGDASDALAIAELFEAWVNRPA
jgi:hypothetical protein